MSRAEPSAIYITYSNIIKTVFGVEKKTKIITLKQPELNLKNIIAFIVHNLL